MPKISVVIPIYNVEEYLEDTLNCLLKQSFIEEMEVLMIDDGSTDNSRYIIEKYALDYDNFHAFHKENEGISNSRNMGIDLAKGEYIQFLDGDDYISEKGYETLYELAKKNNSDIVSSRLVRLRRYNIKDSYFFLQGYKNITESLDSVDLNEYPEVLWDIFSTNKLYKTEFLRKNNLKFKQMRYYEDAPFGLESMILADKISICNDIFYYWRIRENQNFSITQQYSDINNFKNRIKMILLCNEIMNKENLNERLKNELYYRWADYDLNIYLKIFCQYDKEYYPEIIRDFKDVMNIIPDEIINSLNSTKKILYKMVENEDIEGLNYFSEMIPDLMINPHIPENLDEEYKQLIDFESDAQKENLYVRISKITGDDDNILINFKEIINYLNDDYPHQTKAILVDKDNNEYPLELNEDFKGNEYEASDEEFSENPYEHLKEQQIIVPISLITDKKHMKIKIEYSTEEFKKENYLRNSGRDAIEYDGFDVEIGIEKNGIFFMDIRPTSDLSISIDNIDFNNDIFTFYGTSSEKIDAIYIENVIDSEKITYPVISEIEDISIAKEDAGELVSEEKMDGEDKCNYGISFSIPYEDILNHPIRKWEIKVENKFKSIRVARKFEFYRQFNKIYIINARNKLLISDDFYNIFEALDESREKSNVLNKKVNLLKKENKELVKDQTRLKNENDELEKRLEDFKSRFVVKFTDKMKRFIRI